MNALHWFEIPARDIERAQRFYETLLATPLKREPMGEQTLAIFPYTQGEGVGGCLISGPQVPPPSREGTLVYLPAAPDLDTVLARVQAAGGRIATPKVTLPDLGVFAHVEDSEGNRVGLFAPT